MGETVDRERCFEWEILQMTKEYQETTRRFLLEVIPEEFFFLPASMSGKYHPVCARGKGGLVIHTKRVCYFVHQIAQALKFDSLTYSRLLFAAIVHDIGKKRTYEGDAFTLHPLVGADLVAKNYKLFATKNPKQEANLVADLVRTHMGPYGPDGYNDVSKFSLEALVLYLSDYLASRKNCGTFIDEFVVPYQEIEDEAGGDSGS